jgi:ubiquinone/menaquinone biosynthesis C-methylase UbiE
MSDGIYVPAHDRVYARRIRVLASHLADLIPRDATVLDVGSGDGALARRVMQSRPDLKFTGVDVLVRPGTHIPVERFDGTRLPFPDDAFDVITLVDVLHHAADQMALLRDIGRVARRAVVIKDHIVAGLLAHPTLRFMDWVGNARHRVALPFSYWTEAQWRDSLAAAGLRVRDRRDHLGLYAWPLSLVFERGLHFVAVLEPTTA